MRARWYCEDCAQQIRKEDVEAHETEGHDVSGLGRPDRLLGHDPWNVELSQDDAETRTGVED